MTSVFNKSGIVVGILNNACLVCDVDLNGEHDATSHMLKDEHKLNLQCCTYMDEFIDDKIRTVKTGYFCEICNLCLPSLESGRIHVLRREHIRKNDTVLFKCLGTDLLLYKDVPITIDAWNGIVEGKCMFCEVSVENVEKHISEPEHKAKITKDDVEFRIMKGLYRMFGKTFQCMTCNEVFKMVPTSIMACVTTHFSRIKHREILQALNKVAGEVKDKEMLQEIEPEKERETFDADEFILKKEPMSKFVTNFYTIEVPFMGGTDVVINGKFVVNIFSFYFITKDTMHCAACNMKLAIDHIDNHNGTAKHEAAMKVTPVVVIKSAEDEFIREVRPGEFHCGFCNSTVDGISNLMEHFQSFSHRESKTSASWRLHMYLVTKKKPQTE